MKNKPTEAPTAIYKVFPTVKHNLPLVNTYTCVCCDHAGIIVPLKKSPKLNLRKGYIAIAILLACIFMPGGQSANAQQNRGYDETEYDGTYDYEDGSEYEYGEYSQYFRSAEGSSSRYKGHQKEEELYNGGYRKYMKEDQSWKPGQWGNPNIGWKQKHDQSEAAIEGGQSIGAGPNKWSSNAAEGVSKNRDLQMVNADGTISGSSNEPVKGSADGDDNHDFGPPPPPDEPDVPVDTAIPLLIAGGIIIASFRFYIKKSGSY